MPGNGNPHERNYIRSHPVIWLFLFFAAVLVLILPLLENLPSALQKWADTEVTITGIVRESREGNSYLWLKPEGVDENLYVLLSSANQDKETAVWYPAGCRVQLSGTLKMPQEQRNPGGFDEKQWLLSEGARMKLYADKIVLLEVPKGVWNLSWKAQCYIKQTTGRYLEPHQYQLALALLLGEKQYLNPEFYRLAQRMGIAHIFAVSGLHVGFVAAMFTAIFRLMRLERSWLSFFILASAICFYCVITGLAPSTIRAALMVLLAAVAMRLLRPPAPVDFLALAAILLLLENPFLLYTAGFQLSFGVTLSLLLFARPLQKKLKWIPNAALRDSLSVVMAACAGSIPLTMWHFYTLSCLSPFYNLLLVPLVSFAVPVLLLAVLLEAWVPVSGQILFLPAEIMLEVLYQASEKLASAIGSGLIYTGQPEWPAVLCYMLFLALLYVCLHKKEYKKEPGEKYRYLSEKICILCLIGAIVFSVPVPPDNDELLYLDAGQGSCAVFRTRHEEIIVFDGGAKQRELLSVLSWYGVNHVDAIVLSHGDTDHISGLQQVIEAIPVTYLCMEHSQLERDEVQPLLDAAEACGVTVKPVGSEGELYLKEWEIQLAVYDDRQNETNSRELTAVLKNGKNAIVFPGDLGVDAVHQFLKSQSYITVWTVPHHGSRYSASPILYEELQRKGVKLAVISAGAENRYGHPHDEVLRYLQEQNIPVYRIDQNGALIIRTDAL